jgi:predicted enzyme related to lactoylglutathione lyase
MARLRHFAIVVRDLERAAQFHEGVFEMKRVGR